MTIKNGKAIKKLSKNNLEKHVLGQRVSDRTLGSDILRLYKRLNDNDKFIHGSNGNFIGKSRDAKSLNRYLRNWSKRNLDRAINAGFFEELYLDGVYQEIGNKSEVIDYLKNESGVIIEVGGPTEKLSDYADNSLAGSYDVEPDIITNIVKNQKVDIVLDAKSLPFSDNDDSIKSVFMSCMPGAMRSHGDDETSNLRDGAISEAVRIVKHGGYVIWHGGTVADIDKFINEGMSPAYVELEIDNISNKDFYGSTNRIHVKGAFKKII